MQTHFCFAPRTNKPTVAARSPHGDLLITQCDSDMIRKLLLLLAALLSLGLVVLSVILGAAHWQIRQVEPALPTARDIDLALEETDSAAAISYINTATQAGPLGTIGHIGVLIEWEGNHGFLLDTGMPPARAIAFGKPMEQFLDSEPSETFAAIEVQIGDKVQAIVGIAFTHLHSDHTDGIGGICGAQTSPATVFQSDSQRHLQNFGTDPGEENIAAAACARAVLETGIVKRIEGFPGLVAIAVGGHTPGSTVYAARFNGKIWVFAGDITNDMQSLHDNLDKHWAYSTFIVPENTQRQHELRLWLESLDQREEFEVLVAHDIRAWESSEIPLWQPAQ
jgi:glyoxylase-like metal-dependent hydrolase (beta-lactamase superfamily II)